MTRAIRVLTEDSSEAMIAANNSAAWYGTKERFSEAEYFIAVNKGSRKPFLIAAIDTVVPVPESGENRWAMSFHRYADLNPTDYVADRSSNPAISTQLENILPSLKLDELDWKTVPQKTQNWSFSGSDRAPKPKNRQPRALTIAEAKAGLSVGLGVTEDQIDIIVKA